MKEKIDQIDQHSIDPNKLKSISINRNKNERGCPSLAGGRPAKPVVLWAARVQIPHPALWLRITNFCSVEKINLADAIQGTIGNQADYEETRKGYKKENYDYLVDEHLCLRIEDWLLQQQTEQIEEDPVDDAMTAIEGEKTKEFVDIWIPGYKL